MHLKSIDIQLIADLSAEFFPFLFKTTAWISACLVGALTAHNSSF